MQRFRSVITNSKTDRNTTPTPARFCASELKSSVVLVMSRTRKRTKQSREKCARRQRLETESAPISTTLECSDEAKETAAESANAQVVSNRFVPQPSWSSDEEEALVSFLLLYSSSHSRTFRRTYVSLGKNPSLVQY